MKQKISVTLFGLMVLYTSGAMAQSEKNEVEDSIEREEMPGKALETLSEFWPNLNDIRYFSQTDGETETYEAKLEWQGKIYSIEFATSGSIIDVEQLVEMEEIASGARMGIDEYLQQQFEKVRVTRLQQQFVADDEDGIDDIDFIEDILEEDKEDYIIRYELEIEGRSGSHIGAFELLFDRNGDIMQRRRIVRRSLDNIW
ncbi:MAG TPA: hypothetical protein VKM36_02995 [Balneolaceae bacterium]|nr:hypothetical protein [Balneolaceae bacterium]